MGIMRCLFKLSLNMAADHLLRFVAGQITGMQCSAAMHASIIAPGKCRRRAPACMVQQPPLSVYILFF